MNKILLCILLSIFLIPQSFAVDSRIENIYENFIWVLDAKYSAPQKTEILKRLDIKTQEIRWNNTGIDIQNIFTDLRHINNEYLFSEWLEEERWQTEQKIIELQVRKNLQQELAKVPKNQIVTNLMSNKDIEFIPTNWIRETFRDSKIQRLEYSKYFPVDNNTKNQLEFKAWIIIREAWEYRFIEDYSYAEKIPYSQMIEYFSTNLLTPSKKFLLKQWKYYTYIFSQFKYYQDDYGAYESQLKTSDFSNNGTILYKDENGRYNFITDYSERFIINETELFWMAGKHHLLDYLADDMKYNSLNIESTLHEMKQISSHFMDTSNSQEEYIEKSYSWILENISYTENIDLEDQEIFSAIEAFNQGNGVCTAYAKLMNYFLFFGGISNAEMIRWNVIDAADFPQIGHAWVKVGEDYYDPTFDDPLGSTIMKQRDEYKYFALPRDIFYANRYEYDDLPVWLKLASSQEIQEHIYDRLVRLIPKYESTLSDYQVFGPVIFRETYDLTIKTQITPELLSKQIWSYSVLDNSFIFTQGNEVQQIMEFRYYVLTSKNTEIVLSQLNYDIKDLYLFDWETESWAREWRLAYEITLQ